MSDVFLVESSTNPTAVTVGESVSSEPPVRVFSPVPPALTKRVTVTEDETEFVWRVLEPLSASASFVWDVLAPTVVQARFVYDVWAPVGKSAMFAWNTLEQVGKSVCLEWDGVIPAEVAAEEDLMVMLAAL